MSFVEALISRAQRDESKFGTSKRIIGMMSLVSEELADVAMYYIPDRLTGVIHSTCPGFLPLRYLSELYSDSPSMSVLLR